MFITMGAAANSPPLYSGSSLSAGAAINPDLVTPVQGVYPAVQHSAGLPTSGNFAASVNGLMQAVYAYGGAMIFPEFMAEMRRPRDFLKGMWGAQIFIYICYMFYGLFIYGYQGQYIQTPSYLGVAGYGLQTAGNALAVTSALIAAALYGNIGIKGKSCASRYTPSAGESDYCEQLYMITSSSNSSRRRLSTSAAANSCGLASSPSTGRLPM